MRQEARALYARAMQRLVPVLAVLLASLTGCGSGASPTCVTRSSSSVRLPAVPGRPGAGYFQIPARPDQGALVAVTAARIGRIEMHETVRAGGVSSMRPISRAAADACREISFGPGERHLMLFDIDPSLKAGDQVVLTFHFERGTQRSYAAQVRSAGEGDAGH